MGFRCAVPALAQDDFAAVEARVSTGTALARVGSEFRFEINFECKPPAETDCSNNMLEGGAVFNLASDSFIGGTTSDVFRGSARGNSTPRPRRTFAAAMQAAKPRTAAVAPQDRPRRTEVALLKLGARQRGFSGASNAVPELSRGARTCSWLRNRAGRLRNTRVGARRTCDTPVWLRAKGARRWSFRLRRQLAPGSS